MPYRDKIQDRQVGRNAELFARAIATLPAPEKRYAYLRILVSIIEQAHPEWKQVPVKTTHITTLILRLSGGALDGKEVEEVIRVRDEERGLSHD